MDTHSEEARPPDPAKAGRPATLTPRGGKRSSIGIVRTDKGCEWEVTTTPARARKYRGQLTVRVTDMTDLFIMHTCGSAYELSVKLSPHSLHRDIFNVTVALLVKATVTNGQQTIFYAIKYTVPATT